MASVVAASRTLTVYNACPFTMWPAIYTTSGGQPNQTAGWSAAPYSSQVISVPNDWIGRVWGRRNCNFTVTPGPNSCLTGGCPGGLVCTGPGTPPNTLAEFNFDSAGPNDYYDVSLIDGYDLPMRIDNNADCGIPSCPVDLGPDCPAAQKGPLDPTGFPVGCKSACEIDIANGVGANSPNCCSGTYNTPSTCPSSGVTNYDYFKLNCAATYVYPFDEFSGTSLFNCPTSKNAAYTITFCPPSL
ncbi:hypothetical protein MSAN_01035600 [Mycena sanguinolenta]|uniref:Thaumatin-like protein n=1 Tax=Mycena sanguinolenta TaxID=230812 RepID=A0A8H7D9G4_9AGAR|nr:hypothetical protein MSAN_01035600 [Mycena sanguinolenta]